MKDISQILKSLGLVDSEIKTYLQALQRGPSTVLDLSKYTDLSRQATYVAIESLTERGLMSSVLRGKKHYYAAEDPSKLLAYAKRRQQEMTERVTDLQGAIPELELQMGGERPTVKFYEGIEGVKALMADMIESNPKQMYEIADVDAMYKVLSLNELQPLRERIKKLNTKIRGLYSGATSPKTVDVDRFMLPEKYSKFKTSVSVYKNRVAIAVFGGKVSAIIIENEELANTMRILLESSFEHHREKRT